MYGSLREWFGGRGAENGPDTSLAGYGLHVMSWRLDLRQSIRPGFDPGESFGVVQAWSKYWFNGRFRECDDNSLGNLGNKSPGGQFIQKPCLSSQPTSREVYMVWFECTAAQDATQQNHERHVL